MEEIKDFVKYNYMFQKNYPNALDKIYGMSLHEKECSIQSCYKCGKGAQVFENQASNICRICIVVGKYIEKNIKDLKFPKKSETKLSHEIKSNISYKIIIT